MRKFIILTACFSVLGFAVPDLAWGACGITSVGYDGNQDADDDEFVYQYYGDFADCDKTDSTTKTCRTKGYVWECDDGQCTNGTFLYTGGYGTWKGKQDKNRYLRCAATGNDRWEAITVKDCDESIYKNYNKSCLKDVKNSSKKIYSCSQGYYCFFSTEALNCFAAQKRGEPANWTGQKCNCGSMNGVDYTWNGSKCVAKTNSGEKKCGNHAPHTTWEVGCNDSGVKIANGAKCGCRCNSDGTQMCYVTQCAKGTLTDEIAQSGAYKGKYKRCVVSGGGGGSGGGGSGGGGGGSGGGGTPTCKQSRTTPNGVACCDLSSAEAKYNKSTDQCVCIDTTKTFEIQNGKGVCVVKNVNDAEEACKNAAATGAYWDGKECKCKNPEHKFNGTICAERADITECKQVSGARWDDASQSCVCNDPSLYIDKTKKQCVKSAATIIAEQEAELVAARAKSRTLIINAGRTLDSMKDGFGKSVWKNKDGGFNTARLASDSIAGVVLGTAGGLITSNVIKKNQIKGGFEDIKCTISGQTVADWGDEFQAGISLNSNY